MPAATLIVNPAASRAYLLAAQLPALKVLLGRHGYSSSILTTSPAPGSAAALATQAAATASLVLACGGDGTVHGVLQRLAQTGVWMGILPLGTHNALVGSLGLPLDPSAALRSLLASEPTLLPLGQIATEKATRFFITMAGCGPSGALAHLLASSSRGKARLGRAIYPVQAARLLATRRWPSFRVEYRLPASTTWQTGHAASLLVSRVPSLGGLFARLTPRAYLRSPLLHAYVLRGPLHLTFPAWFATSLAGLPNRWLQQIEAEEIRCTGIAATPLSVQADAEPLGTLPCSLRIVPAALHLLMPRA